MKLVINISDEYFEQIKNDTAGSTQWGKLPLAPRCLSA